MSKRQLIRTIKKEIADLNWVIDMKIVKGLSYKKESKRHSLLCTQLNYLTREERQSGFFSKLGRAFATLVL